VRVYLAGPVTDAFTDGVRRLTAAGLEVANRHEHPEPADTLEWGHWMRRALADVLTVDGVAILPKSGRLSRGAGIACRVAHDLGIPVRTIPAWLTKTGQDAYMARLLEERP
jgi:hypothetical protein